MLLKDNIMYKNVLLLHKFVYVLDVSDAEIEARE